MNRVFLIGNLVKDPELRYTPNSKAVCTLRIAHNKRYGEKEKTIYADIVCWGKTAENCHRYLVKGAEILVEGELDYQSWEKEGNLQSKHEIVADKVTFLRKATGSSPLSEPDEEII